MSGIEAVYWAAKYPDEIAGLIGLDMAAPGAYKNYTPPRGLTTVAAIGVRIGIQRIPFIYPVSDKGLTEAEYGQARLLTYRNAYNDNMLAEGKILLENVDKVSKVELPAVPVLLFSSDGTEVLDGWADYQNEFAKASGADLITLDCGHYIHQHRPSVVAAECRAFFQKNFPAFD
jgi:pimeloyl-ACP methyl ester carboxylesterase